MKIIIESNDITKPPKMKIDGNEVKGIIEVRYEWNTDDKDGTQFKFKETFVKYVDFNDGKPKIITLGESNIGERKDKEIK